jgi:large subunit ribosomal protein L5
MTRLQAYYIEKVVPQLEQQLGYQNVMQVPRVVQVVLNMGLGTAKGDKKVIERAVADMTAIAGQKPVITKARRSVSNFKIREGWPIGCKVNLRRERMYEFLDRLINIAIPRIRDFRGFSVKAFDGRGNYSLGIREQIIFPEIDYDKIDTIRGMDITISTSARTDKEGRALLLAFNFPLKG